MVSYHSNTKVAKTALIVSLAIPAGFNQKL